MTIRRKWGWGAGSINWFFQRLVYLNVPEDSFQDGRVEPSIHKFTTVSFKIIVIVRVTHFGRNHSLLCFHKYFHFFSACTQVAQHAPKAKHLFSTKPFPKGIWSLSGILFLKITLKWKSRYSKCDFYLAGNWSSVFSNLHCKFFQKRTLKRLIYSSEVVCEQVFGDSCFVYKITRKKRGNLATIRW